MSPSRISAVILTLNEERRIEFCLRSLHSWCDEIVIVDMFSEDGTRDICHRYGALIVDHERITNFDLARKPGIDAASGDWILSIDADEVVTPELARWIREFADSEPAFQVALIPRVNVFLGRWLRSTPWWPGKPRLFRPDAVEVTAELHHGLVPKPGTAVARLPKRPELSMWHFARISLEEISAKTNHYSSIQAHEHIAAGDGDPSWSEVFSGALREIILYVAKRGYRDGRGGLFYAVDRAYLRFLTQAKRWDEAQVATRQTRYNEWREKILSRFPDSGRVQP